VSGGLNADLSDLGLDNGNESLVIGGRLIGKWLTLRADFRRSEVDTAGETESELRLNVDSVLSAGANVEYLLIPVNTDYRLEAESDWLGVGLQFTPFTLQLGRHLSFTPWLHLGVQWVSTTFDLDTGNTLRLEVSPFQGRTFAVGGRAAGTAEVVIPEYGAGGELRWRFQPEEPRGGALVLSATWKILDFNGALDDLGVEDDDFERIDFDYSSLAANFDLYLPLGERVEFLAGVYMETADIDTTLASKPGSGNFSREVDLGYTLYGLRIGLLF
jgi:hypothetical protein